jgi:acetyltransferase-like isoleucine patch superfamily enzyme
VVTRPVPPFTVAVGTPAKPIEYFGPEPAREAPPARR